MHKFFSVFIILLLFSCKQNSLEDTISTISSLQEKAKNNVNDSTLVCLRQAQRLIDKNDKLPDTLQIENIFRKGYYYLQLNELDSAGYYFHRTIDLIEGPNNRKKNLIYFKNTWENDENIDNLTNGISVVQKFIEISDPEYYSDDLVFAYNFLERIHLDLGDYKASLDYNTKASESALKASNMDMYVITGNSRAITNYIYLNEKEDAFKVLDSMSTIDCGLEAKRQFFGTNGVLKFYENDYKGAIQDYKMALDLSKKVEANQNYNLLESYLNISEAYIELGDYEIAEKYLDSANTNIRPDSFHGLETFYYRLRFQLNYRTKKDETELLDEFSALIEKNNKDHQRRITEELTALKLSDETKRLAIAEKNEADINNLKLWGLSGVLGVLILSGILFYRQRRFKFERENLQMQQRLLRSQMNPHFIFNTLSVIQNQVKANKAGAENYLLKFSRLLRLILENSLSDYVQIENELESLRKYLDLQLMRFPEKFSYTIVTENFEEDELLFIPPMLIQPFIENSIEHGFLGIDYKGDIKIELVLQEKWMSCKIEDNGIGLNTSGSGLKNSISVSLISKFIRKVTNQNISIKNKKDTDSNISGVRVEFLIPYKYSNND